LREQQIRPFVVVDFEVEEHVFYVVVENVGSALARDVRFAIEPAFTTSLGRDVGALNMFSNGISSLAPKKRIRTVFDAATQRKAPMFPDKYSVGITYRDQDRQRAFHDEIDLDLGIYRNLGYIDRKGIHDLHERLREIGSIMSRWGTPSGGLLTVSPHEARQESDRRIAEFEAGPSSPDTQSSGGRGRHVRQLAAKVRSRMIADDLDTMSRAATPRRLWVRRRRLWSKR